MREASLVVAWECNAACHFCRYRKPYGEPPPSTEHPFAAARQLLAEGHGRLLLTGGEPTTSDALPELIAMATRAGAEAWLETNAHRLADRDYFESLTQVGLRGARVVAPSLNPRRYEALMARPGSWELFRRGLGNLRAAGCPTWLALPLGLWNAQEAATYPRWVQAAGLQGVRVVLPEVHGTPVAMQPQLAPWSRLAPIVSQVVAVGEELGVPVEPAPGTALPYCLTKERPLPAAFYKAHERSVEEGPGRTGKPESCQECAMTAECRGLPESYRQRFGDGELVPLDREEARRLRPALKPLRSKLDGKYNAELKAAEADTDRWGTFRRKTLVLRVNGACNIRCVHCWVDFKRPDAALDDMLQRVEEAAANGVYEIAFSGGEPSMYQGLERLIRRAKELGIPSIELQTNAMRCKDAAYAQSMAAAGVTKAFTTLLGSSEEVSRQAALSPKAHTETVAGLHNLCEAGVACTINYVINRVNLSDLGDFVAFYDREFFRRHDNISLNLCVAQPINDLAMESPQWERAKAKFPDAPAFDSDTPVPSIAELRGPLRAAVDFLLERGIPFHGLNSLSGVPLCVLDGDERCFPRKHRWQGSHMEKIFTKLPQCAECAVERFCMGVRRNYLELHGEGGIVPVKEVSLTQGR